MVPLFISYSSKDQSQVNALAKRLAADQYECWLDREDIRSGELWTKPIVQAIHACEVFILVLSPNSVQSGS